MNRLLLFKRFQCLLILLLAVLAPAVAQKHQGRSKHEMRKEMKDFHMKFLAQEIDLKEDQQKPFFDTYSQMMEERRKIFDETRNLEKRLRDGKATEEEYETVTAALTNAKERDAAIEKKYDEKFSKILTPKQLYKLKEAEEKWRAKMQEMRHSNRRNRK